MRDLRRQLLRVIHFGLMALTLSLLAALLTGCSLSLTNPNPKSQSSMGDELASSWGWVISQGEEPQACEKEISRQEARKEAQEALKTEEEAQKIQQTLASLGKRLMVWRAQGCEVKTEDGNTTPQGLRALSEGDETILVEVPAGADAALYLVENESAEEGNYWASLKESLPYGERLTHIEMGLEEDAEVQGLGEGIGKISFFLPDEDGTKEITQHVKQLLQEDSSTSSAGVSGMHADGLDWGNAEVVILEDSTSEEQDALIVVPSQGASGQRLWGRRGPDIDVESALHIHIRVKKTTPQGSARPQLHVVRPTPERPVAKKGVELKPAFKYCPYRYYGKLRSFRRVLCQDSWKHWYKKQWKSGDIYDKWVATYNQAAQLHLESGRTPSIFLKGYNLLLYGFERLDGDLIRQMISFAKEHPWQPPVNGLYALPPLPQDILQALKELAQLLNDPNFAQRLNELKGRYPGFAEMLATSAQATGKDELSLAQALAALAQDQRFDELWVRYGRIKRELLNRGIIKQTGPGQILPPLQCCGPEWRYGTFSAFVEVLLLNPGLVRLDQQLAFDIIDGFFTALERFLEGKNVFPSVDANKLIEDLLDLIPGPYMKLVIGIPPILEPTAPEMKDVMDFIRLAQLLGNMVVKGVDWQFIRFGRKYGPGEKTPYDLIATADISGLGQVTTVAKAYDQLPANAADEIQRIIDFARDHAEDYPGKEVVFVFVGGGTRESDVDNVLNKVSPSVPVVVVYCKANCNGPNPEYGLKWKGDLTEQEARQIACAHGFTQFCGSESQYSSYEGSPPTTPTIVTPPPPEPSKCYGKICII